jgi:hypothetical protein
MIKMLALIFALANPGERVELVYKDTFQTMEACEAAKPEVQELLNDFLTSQGVDLTTVGTELICTPDE